MRETMDVNRRLWLAGLASLAVTACVRDRKSTPRFDAVLSTDAADAAIAPVYARLSEALAAAPSAGARPYRVLVRAGTWREKVIIDKPSIHLIGEGGDASVLSFDAAAGQRRPDGEPWGTWGSASIIVRAPDFRASRLRIENAFDYIGNLYNPNFQPIGPNGLQAVALMLDRGSDRALFEDCVIAGHQDTLFADAGRAWFRRCRIVGSVDFVFGGGCAVFEDGEIHSLFRPGKDRQGYLAAPCTSIQQPVGLVFARCRLTRDPAVPDGTVALGRSWRPGRKFPDGQYGDPDAVGAAAFVSCWMDTHIAPEGWDPMAYTARDGSRVMLEPGDARLFEHDSRGPGARVDARRRQLTAEEVSRYLPPAVFGDWRVST